MRRWCQGRRLCEVRTQSCYKMDWNGVPDPRWPVHQRQIAGPFFSQRPRPQNVAVAVAVFACEHETIVPLIGCSCSTISSWILLRQGGQCTT